MTYGMAQTNKFMLGAASLMIGAQTDLFNLTRTSNGLGLIKNFKLETKPTFVDLTQGVKNTLVYSVMNGHSATCSAEVYEYSPRNLQYFAQLNGATFVTNTLVTTTLSAAVTGTSGSPATTFSVTSATGFAAGNWVLIADPNYPDDAVVRQISSIATNVITPVVPIGRNLAANSTVDLMNYTPVASKNTPPFFSAMVTGALADGTDIALALPKIRITSGLNLAFQTNDYGNIPLEFQIYDLVPSDPNYATFGSVPAAIFSEG